LFAITVFSFSWLQPALAFSLRIYSKAFNKDWIKKQPTSIVGHADACSQSPFLVLAGFSLL